MPLHFFQKYYLWFCLVLSGLAGLAMGNLRATIFSVMSEPQPSEPTSIRTDTRQSTPKPTLKNYQDIVKRNIFNSASSDLSVEFEEQALRRSSAPSKWSLIGTVSGGPNPLATLSDSSGAETYALNEELSDGGVLSEIERNRVVLHYPGGRTQTLEVDENQQLAAQPQTQRREPPGQQNELHIDDLGGNRWRIPTSVAENARENVGELLKQAQAIPYLEGGKTTGFKIETIQRGSLIDKLGLKRGDILRRINGQELNAPEKALQIFGQLRQAKQIRIDLERRGKTMTFAYEIR